MGGGAGLSSARPPHAQLLFVLRNRSCCESSERQISKLSKINRASWMKGIRQSNSSGTVNRGTIYIDLQTKLVLGKLQLRPDKLRVPVDERYPSLESSPLSLRGEKFQ